MTFANRGHLGAWRAASLVLALGLLHACGAGPAGPTPHETPTVSAATPRMGTSLGGTQVMIEGTNFAAGAVVAFGDTAATNAVVNSSTSIVATTPPRTAGITDVSVTVGGRSATLPGAFTFIAPTLTNQPPVLRAD